MNFIEMQYPILEIAQNPGIVIDVNHQKIVYVNRSCHELLGISEGCSSRDMYAFLNFDRSWEGAKSEVLSKLKNSKVCVLSDVKLRTLTFGTQLYDLRIGYVDDEHTLICIFFTFSTDKIDYMARKNHYFDVIYSFTSSYPFQLNIKSKEIQFFGPILETFNLPSVIKNYPESILDSGTIHEDDVSVFKIMVEKMYRGDPPTDVFRCYDTSGNILWYQPKYVVHRDANSRPIELVGEFVNVQHAVELETMLKTDGLTGCYTKTAFENNVQEILTNSTVNDTHALLIIDIDNFKNINDYLGHHFGDIILQEIGENLRKIFRSNDLVGRIGGDEFMVLMRDVPNVDAVSAAISRVLSATSKKYSGKHRTCEISSSIGVGIYPTDGEDFEILYKHSDIALYQTKNKGKNGVTYYDASLSAGTMRNSTPFDVASRAMSQHFDSELVSAIFSLLFNSTEFDLAIDMVLQRIGTRFGADRSYIFEINEDGSMSNTHEWCNAGINPHIKYFQNVPKEAYFSLFEMANQDGIVYCNDMSIFEERFLSNMHNDHIKSCLCSLVKENNHVKMMLGLDDCKNTRIWSPVEISSLMHISKIIALFEKCTHTIDNG